MKTITTILSGMLMLFFVSPSVLAVQVGESAPVFSVPQLQSQQVKTLEQYHNQVVYLDFWASWCAPCRLSFPELEKLYRQYQMQGFRVAAINLDEEKVAADKFLNTYSVSFDILRDQEGQWADVYGVETMPTSFIIDKKGMIRYIHKGFAKVDVAEIEQQIKLLLMEQ